MEETKQGLKRTMGFFPALATVMGTVIGGGVFFKAAAVAADTGSASLHMFAWFLGGVISVCAGLTGAELAAAIPETGGMVKYIERTYGGMAGFLLGWAQVLIYMPANVAALAIIFGTQFVNLFGLGTNLIVPIAIVTALIILLINFISAKAGGVFQSIALVMKLVPIALIVIVGLFFGNGHTVSIFPIVSGHGNSLLQGLGAGLLATMFAYDGWIHVGNIAGELKRPSKDLPRAIAFGIIAVMAVYLLVNYVFIKTIGFDEIYGALNTQLGSALPPTEVASRLFGDLGGKLVTIGILISVAGTVNGYTMTGMRLPYVLAKEKTLPFWKKWEKLSDKTNIPVNAGWLMLVIAIIMMIVSAFSNDAFNMLTDMLVFVIWIFYTLVFVAVFILRKREPELDRPYKVPLYPVIPAIAILGGLFILVMTIINQPILVLIGVGITLLGIPVYVYMAKKYAEK